MSATFSVAIDIGGTFTDVTLQDARTGLAWRAKTQSVPSDPSQAFIAGIRLALDAAGSSPEEIGRVLHGTTVATNLILEGKGARTALITTAGFRHVLEIGRQDIPRRANLYAWRKPARPVPPARVLEVTERIAAGGTVQTPLDEASVHAAAEACRAFDVAAVAVCLLHSFANPVHEQRVVALLRELLPGVVVTASIDVLPVAREYERTLATVLNATVMPAVSSYVARLSERTEAAGIVAPLLLMQSNGGVAGIAAISRAPAVTALSGPAAGIIGARAVAAACGIGDVITVDVGGTSADICLIKDSVIGLTQNGRVGEWPLPLPMVDMVTVGAGGGSIARVVGAGIANGSAGALGVGPASAGAVPGPACYGKGGTAPTVTDAHVVLGHLPPSLLGGRMTLDPAAAAQAIADHVATPLGLHPHAAARGILAIADNNMVGAIRVVSVERGHDPRAFTLVRRCRPAPRVRPGRDTRHHDRAHPARPGRALRRGPARGRLESRVEPHPADRRHRHRRRGRHHPASPARRRGCLAGSRARPSCRPLHRGDRAAPLRRPGRRTRRNLGRQRPSRHRPLRRHAPETIRLRPPRPGRAGHPAHRGHRRTSRRRHARPIARPDALTSADAARPFRRRHRRHAAL